MATDKQTGMDLISRRGFIKAAAGVALAAAGGGLVWLGVQSVSEPPLANVQEVPNPQSPTPNPKSAVPAFASLVTRAAHAANTSGWRQLGVLNGKLPSNANFRECDILYNPDDGMYCVFSTEGDGNPPPVTPISASTDDTPTTITAPGHRLKVGMQIYIKGHLNDLNGKISALNNRNPNLYYRVSALNVGGDPDAFQVVSLRDETKPVTSSGGYGGTVNYLPDPHIAMRRAPTPEGITLASGGDYVEYVSTGVWYPTVLKEGNFGSSAWHLWGTNGQGSIGHHILKGDRPGPSLWPPGVTVGSPLYLGDISVRKNPADGYWYAVGLGGARTDLRIYRSKDIAKGNEWTAVGEVFADGHPEWSVASHPDPNLCFVDGRAYVFLTGGKVFGEWSTGVVEIDIATGKAKGQSAILLQYGAYPSWMNSVLSDLVFLPAGHDGVDRIFAFGGVPYYSGQNAVWGCLDLP